MIKKSKKKKKLTNWNFEKDYETLKPHCFYTYQNVSSTLAQAFKCVYNVTTLRLYTLKELCFYLHKIYAYMPQKSFCQLPFILSSNKRYCNSPQLCVCVRIKLEIILLFMS